MNAVRNWWQRRLAAANRCRMQRRYHWIEHELLILEEECAQLKDEMNRLIREQSRIEVALID